MKITKYSILVALLLLNFAQVYSQVIFREGYIINQSGDTLNGLIEYRGASKIPQSVVFKRFDIALPVNYGPSQIVAFGYKDANHYELRPINGVNTFIECYVKGKISLFGNDNRLFIEKDGKNFTELKQGPITIYSPDGEKNYSNFVELFKDITSDNSEYQVPSNLALRRGNLVTAISKYNKLTNTESREYNYYAKYDYQVQMQSIMIDSDIRKHFGFSTSMAFKGYSIGLVDKNNMYNDLNVSGSVKTYWEFGAFYLRQISRKNRKIWLKADLLFSNSKAYYQTIATRKYPTEYQSVTIWSEKTNIKAPVALLFSSGSYGFNPYFSTGLMLNLNISSKNSGELSTSSSSGGASYKLDESKYRINQNIVNYFVSTGFIKSVGKNAMFYLEAKAELMLTSHETQMKWTTNTYDYYEYNYYYGPKIEITNPSPYISVNFGLGF